MTNMEQVVDSKALLINLLKYLPALLIAGVAGAVIGSGLNLIVLLFTEVRNPEYVAETEYYIEFSPESIEAKHYYNDYTWNDVVGTDLILGEAMADIGGEYERAEIKSMITADIYSDIRYLIITVRGHDKELVGRVSDALHVAIENFGDAKKEFEDIYQIEDLGVLTKEIRLFNWRAALLGFFVSVIITMFVMILCFSLGDRFYTKNDIMVQLRLTVFGLVYKNTGKNTGMQARLLISNLQKALNGKEKVYIIGTSSEAANDFKDIINSVENAGDIVGKLEIMTEKDYTKSKYVILTVPFGKACREQLKDMMDSLRQQDYEVIGAVLTETDYKWTRLYYGKKWL